MLKPSGVARITIVVLGVVIVAAGVMIGTSSSPNRVLEATVARHELEAASKRLGFNCGRLYEVLKANPSATKMTTDACQQIMDDMDLKLR